MAKTTSKALSVSLEPYSGKDDGLSTLQQAMTIEVTDRASHQIVLADIKRWKDENREIEAFYSNSKKDGLVDKLYSAYTTARDLRDSHLRPRKEAIAEAEKRVTGYVRDQERREREEADRLRREAEAQEQARRDEEAARAEAEALRLEASSNVLSVREQAFVTALAANGFKLGDPAHLMRLATQAGFKAKDAVKRLMDSKKINDAIANAQKAAAIRRESEAKQAAPILVETPVVESQIGKVSGVSQRTYYGCEPLTLAELQALVQAVAEGTIEINAVQANMVFLNEQARSLKGNFTRVFPMLRLSKREGIAG